MTQAIISEMKALLIVLVFVTLPACYRVFTIEDDPGGGATIADSDINEDTGVGFDGVIGADAVPDSDWRTPREQIPDRGLEWVGITGGSFLMGREDSWTNVRPVRSVEIPGFEMMRAEVTAAEYRACVDDGACGETHALTNLKEDLCNLGRVGRDDHPMNCVDWEDAVAFCEWAGGWLPSEAEWEYAARSRGEERKYPWGNDALDCDHAVISTAGSNPGSYTEPESGCGQKSTWPVCSKPLGDTDQGLCDMIGNVHEWVADDYHVDYTGAPIDGSPWVTGEEERVRRGGGWIRSGTFVWDGVFRLRSGKNGGISTGFRCARLVL